MVPSILFKPTKWNVATAPADMSGNFALIFGYVMELDLEGQFCRSGTSLNTDLTNDKQCKISMLTEKTVLPLAAPAAITITLPEKMSWYGQYNVEECVTKGDNSSYGDS